MDKKLIRLTESDLHKIVKESVNNIMKDYAGPPSKEEIAFFKFIHNGNLTPIQCSKAGVDYDLLKKYRYLMRHYYSNGTEDPAPLENEIKKQFIANYRRLQKQGWLKEERNNMGMVRYCVVDRTNTPNAFCGGSFNTKEQGIEQLKRAKRLYPNNKWTLEAIFSIGGKEKKRKNLGDPLVRLTENDIQRIVRESVEDVISEVSAMPKGFKHRFDPDKRDGDFPLEQPEWTKDPRWQGWNGEDPEWIMKQEKESGDPYYGNKKQARVSESQLHQIVKESVEQVLSEGLFGNLFKSPGQREFERRRKEAQDAYSKFKREEEEYDKNHIDPRTISDDDMDRNDYKRMYGTTAGYSPDWRERRQREMQTQRKAYLNGRSHY